ncbi:hypothetical protein D3C81_1271280 [compost metagenome]
MARHHRYRAELAHRPRIAQDHAVQQAPADIGQRDMAEGLPARGAQHDRCLFLFAALRLHQRDQLARDEGEGHEDRRQHDAGHREHDLDVMRFQPRAEPALRAEQQHVDQARDHRRHRERQVDQRDQQVLAAELELGDGPCRRHAEHHVQRHRDRRHRQRELDRGHGIGFDQRFKVGLHALAQRFVEDRSQRHEQEQREEQHRQRDQRVAHPWCLAGGIELVMGPVLALCAQASRNCARHVRTPCPSRALPVSGQRPHPTGGGASRPAAG